MLSFNTNFIMTEDFKSSREMIRDTVGDLPYWDISVHPSNKMRELLFLLDRDIKIPGVLILEKNELVGLIPREKVYEKLGRPFGVELFLKQDSRRFYELLGITTLVLKSDTPITDAVEMALMRNEQTLYEPIVVSHPKGFRVISMYALLMGQQTKLQELYSEVDTLSKKDPLTFVNNRRGFFVAANQQLTIVRDSDLEYAVMMIDLDDFKNINDRYGHLVGDEVLKSVVQGISNQLREKDLCGRFGGDELVTLLMGVSRESAFDLGEKIRQNIASIFHIINGFQIRVTISIGISHSKGASKTLDTILAEADQALYAAKSVSRNKVQMWNETLGPPPNALRIVRSISNEVVYPNNQILDQTLHGLLRMLYLRDYETEAHTLRVAEAALNLAKKVGVPEKEIDGIYVGALLHDIGKIAIPDNILFKPGKLTDEEWLIMQKHPQYAHDLLSPILLFQHALEIPYCHHEHWDGTGYPRGLRKEEIPLAARIFSIVDVWDALSSDRPYRAAWSDEAVNDFLVKQTGILFDTALVPLFFDSMNAIPTHNP
ncbi:MAG: diguanylate cyclase [Anaerolineales bacterium]